TMVGTRGYTGRSASCTRYSRPMSCADRALVPAGGRRRTRSRLRYVSRYVQFDAPEGYCVISDVPSRPGTIARNQASAAAAPASPPRRQAPAPSPAAAVRTRMSSARVAAFGELDARDQALVHFVWAIGDAQAARRREQASQRRIPGHAGAAMNL